MAATDARFIPIKNAIRRETFVLRDAVTGEPVTGATIDSGLGSGAGKAYIIKDGGAAANSTNNVVELTGGFYHLDLTATEMNADTVLVKVRSTTTDCVDATVILYTEPRSVRDLTFPTVTGRSMDVDATGGVEVGSIVPNAINAAAIATDAFTNAKFAVDAIGSDELALSALIEIASVVWGTTATEPPGVPAINADFGKALSWLLALSRNKRTQTATTEVLRNDADNANLATSTKSDDGTTFTRGEYA